MINNMINSIIAINNDNMEILIKFCTISQIKIIIEGIIIIINVYIDYEKILVIIIDILLSLPKSNMGVLH